jgi:protein-tyrosine kinase
MMNIIEKAMNKLAQAGPPLQPSREAEMAAPVGPAYAGQATGAVQSDPDAVVNPMERTKRAITLDLERIRQYGMLVPDTHRSRIREEYRHIKRPLLMNAAGKGATLPEYGNVIMVTSANPGEGKTFTASNLALSIATERDRTVLLVDADLVRPSVNKLFGFEAELGLVDFLIEDHLELSDVLIKTDIPSLTILPAGNSHHLSTELLASENMRVLVQGLSERYADRIVIFDSPPLLATSEASVLASLVGQVVMVVEAEKTRQSQVKEALALLNSSMIVGFVLNKMRRPFTDYYYGYGYGYGYGGYGYGYGYGSYGYSDR